MAKTINNRYLSGGSEGLTLDGKFVSKEAKRTIQSINKACVEVGFFQITGHGISLKEINKTCNVGNKFFNSSKINKEKLSPQKWNKKNKNLYRGYFPNDVNGKEGLDIGDLKVTKKYSLNLNNQYIEFLNLDECFKKSSITVSYTHLTLPTSDLV